MSEHAANPDVGMPDVRDNVREISGYWWVGLVAGIAWLVISLVILQFDSASVTTVGVLVGVMFLLAAVQNIALTTLPVEHRWVPALFSVLFLVSAVICFIDPVTPSPGWPTCSVSCSCSSACGGWSSRSSSGRSTRCGGSP